MFGSSSKNQADARSASPERDCDHPDCAEAGEHRAPRSRDELDSYFWFCRDHARSYNADWNFFLGMDRKEIEDYTKADLTWHRPTWRLGGKARIDGEARLNSAWQRRDFGDPYSIFDNEEDAALHRMPLKEREARAVLNLPGMATDDNIKARYKELVKRLHPDINGDDKQAVDQLKAVIEAYRTLSRRAAL
ncbi:MAG: DnaJ domain-containing protein [Alphaproteobacteria bacterium]